MYYDTRLGNNPRRFHDKPKDWAMRIPDAIRKNVAFLGRKITKGGSEESLWFGGTGFFINVPAATRDRWYVYLVTAKHVAEQLSLGDWLVRINMVNGKFEDIHLNKCHKWYFHPDDKTTDVAITQVQIPEFADIAALPESTFLCNEEFSSTGVGAGDDLYMVGLFNKMRGTSRNQPIVRMGNIAMIPDAGELVPGVNIGYKEGEGKIPNVVETEAYLIEARSLGGLSGSPVFVRPAVSWPDSMHVRGGSPEKVDFLLATNSFYLLGLVNSHWEIDPKERNEPYSRSFASDKSESVNMGIAVVIPVKKIRETLYHPELVAQRARTDATYTAEQGTTCID